MMFIETWEAELWGDRGASALEYLRDRGLRDETIRKYRLGYNPTDQFDKPVLWGLEGRKLKAVCLYRGIVIPGLIEGVPWYVKIRRSVKEKNKRYRQVSGGTQPVLFGADNLAEADCALLTEGEFDAMLADQELGDLVGVASFGSTAGYKGKIDLDAWGKYLIPLRAILTALDSDEDGKKAAELFAGQSAKIRSLRVPKLDPDHTDLTDYHLDGGDLRVWFVYQFIGDEYETWEERAAIMEYCGGMSREEAEAKALERVLSLRAAAA